MPIKGKIIKVKKATFLLDEELLVALKIQAAKERTSMSEIISRVVTRYLKEREKGGKR